ALEISEGVLRGIATHPVVAEAVRESDEVIVRREVGAGAELDGATLGELTVKTQTGMRIIAVRRTDPGADESWVLSPGPETRLEAGDVVLAKGPRGGVDRLGGLL
ncbi:MAG: TrkA C-terminal domain-containing protein, partial [Haloarculaceae archaeon]